jgi:hypothetical protein
MFSMFYIYFCDMFYIYFIWISWTYNKYNTIQYSTIQWTGVGEQISSWPIWGYIGLPVCAVSLHQFFFSFSNTLNYCGLVSSFLTEMFFLRLNAEKIQHWIKLCKQKIQILKFLSLNFGMSQSVFWGFPS